MPRLIKQTFIVLVLVLLVFDGPLVTRCIFMEKSTIMFILTLIDLNLDERYYYPFIISLYRSNGCCNNVAETFGRICVSNEK